MVSPIGALNNNLLGANRSPAASSAGGTGQSAAGNLKENLKAAQDPSGIGMTLQTNQEFIQRLSQADTRKPIDVKPVDPAGIMVDEGTE